MSKSMKRVDPFYEREALKYGKPIPSREYILEHLEKCGVPVKFSHLVTALSLKTPEEKDALQRRLKAMLRDGQLLINRKGQYGLIQQMALVRGRVYCHRDGYGFLTPDDGGEDVFLGPRQVRSLFSGDRVLASIISDSRTGKREGVVVEILERSLTKIVGRYIVENDLAIIVPVNKDILQEVTVPEGQEGAAALGQLVVSEIISYPTKSSLGVTVRIVEVLGDAMSPGMEIKVASHAYCVPHTWSPDVLAECTAIETTISESVVNERQNLQDLPFVTIDGEDARDFDDAIYCKRLKKGWVLYVAIADVSHYVHIDTAIDQEALNRGNSVYFPEHVIPMLPEILANEVCSLKPKVKRLVMVCEMQIADNGKIDNYKFYDAIIRSHARLTYDEVFAQLEGKSKKPIELLPHLKELKRLYEAFLKQRKARGALDFSRVETKIIFSKDRKIKSIEPVQHNYAHSIIEECMLAANVCASQFLYQHKIPALYRVHESPAPTKLADLKRFLAGFGLDLKGGNKPKTIHYANVLEQIAGRPDEHLLQTVLLRSMQQAVYTPENIGHFGLAYEVYANFTSPIRRYPDLLIHRAIRYLLQGGNVKKYKYTKSMMQNFGDHCSQTERRADEATRDAVSWLKCEYMRNKVGKHFVGIISGVTSFGVFVELKEIFVDGLLHVTALKNDYYQYDPQRYRLIGKHTKKVYSLGDPVKVVVSRVDLDERAIDFELA